ncbi:MAG: right-handed parallel beta-helix repeat-containing protein, partial [Synergistaceae bacterium]|nr:right-handed parallel beta-helix repeat-containing protein [Synergistaceae bacterium]
MREFFFNFGGGGTAFATSWYVVVSGDNNGVTEIKYASSDAEYEQSKWSQATNTSTDINTFLNDAAVLSGDTVYIKEGTYKLSGYINLQNKVLHLYGGFTGTETTSSDRKSDIGTTLDANADSSNLHRVLTITTNSTIDGFTITGGNYNGTCGGILITNSSPTITNCTITGNNTGGDTNPGGGIYIRDNSNPIITNCTITGNNATGNSGGICIFNDSNPIITNCTITGNNANGYGGGIYINYSNPIITNCTIVNNTATSNQGNEIYFAGSTTTTLRNTLIWNASTDNAIYKSDNATPNYDHCAYPSATGDNNIALTSWDNPVSSDEKVKGVTHKVFLAKNNPVLFSLAGKGVSSEDIPTYDQIGNTRANPPSIGAAEIVLPVLSVDITGTDTINTNYGTEKTETFTPIVSLDNVALTTGYTVSWDVVSNEATISISNGVLTVGDTTPAGSYTVTVKAQAKFTISGTDITITSNTASKDVTITVAKGDITLNLTKTKDLPGGTVDTAYSSVKLSEYFTATPTPTAAIAWSINGTLPDGLTCTDGTISGTPTKAGT